jgi:5-methylcytosine-specific restriction endonuclease McrA
MVSGGIAVSEQQKKICSTCGGAKALQEFERYNTSRGVRYRAQCKACRNPKKAISAALYAARHPERIKAKDALYAARHPERIKAKDARYRAGHREKRRQQTAQYDAAHPQQKRLRRLRYDRGHPEKRRARVARWRQLNPAGRRDEEARHRALKAGAAIRDFTSAQWVAMQEHYGHRCVYCQKRCKGKLTQDHIVPLSKGGNHTAANIVPACRSCNSKKGPREVLCPVQPLLLVV